MNFLNIGPWELMIITVIAILAVGPKRVVEIARAIGRITSQMRRLSDDFMATIQTEIQIDEQQEEIHQAVGGAIEGTVQTLEQVLEGRIDQEETGNLDEEAS